jgi:hypothetical protein
MGSWNSDFELRSWGFLDLVLYEDGEGVSVEFSMILYED